MAPCDGRKRQRPLARPCGFLTAVADAFQLQGTSARRVRSWERCNAMSPRYQGERRNDCTVLGLESYRQPKPAHSLRLHSDKIIPGRPEGSRAQFSLSHFAIYRPGRHCARTFFRRVFRRPRGWRRDTWRRTDCRLLPISGGCAYQMECPQSEPNRKTFARSELFRV
jgi:hypothetical protein